MKSENLKPGQSQSLPINQPPNVVSTKDQLYIADMLSWNLNACKKAHFFAQQCENQDVKSALDEAGQMHQRHFQKILKHLNGNQNSVLPQ